MKIKENESLESWAARVEMFEKGRALQRIATGDDPTEVMEDMSRRIKDKMLHPILTKLSTIPTEPYDSTQDRIKYNAIMKNVGKAADHVDTNT